MDENSHDAIEAMIDELARHIPPDRVTTEHATDLFLQILRHYGSAVRATEALRQGRVKFTEIEGASSSSTALQVQAK
jgi:hypothetical protein